eukprot:3200150-Alexandrium_andersonii.AAC.1
MFNSYQNNACCQFCAASKTEEGMRYTDVRATAGWRQHRTTHEQYMATTTEHSRSPLCKIPGWLNPYT